MKNIYSPNNIEVLLHFHTCPHPHPRIDAPAVKEAIMQFLEIGAIVVFDDTYITTRLGHAWVDALCNTPPPRLVFIDEAGRVL